MEYAVAAWSTYTKKDKRVQQKIQRRATRVTISLENLSNKEILLGLLPWRDSLVLLCRTFDRKVRHNKDTRIKVTKYLVLLILY